MCREPPQEPGITSACHSVTVPHAVRGDWVSAEEVKALVITAAACRLSESVQSVEPGWGDSRRRRTWGASGQALLTWRPHLGCKTYYVTQIPREAHSSSFYSLRPELGGVSPNETKMLQISAAMSPGNERWENGWVVYSRHSHSLASCPPRVWGTMRRNALGSTGELGSLPAVGRAPAQHWN